jgi:TonB dependent receptor
LEDPATIHLAPQGKSPWKASHTNFAPRIGFAYQISEKTGRELVLRGGFGVFYDTPGGLAGSLLSGTSSSSTLLFDVAFPLTPTQATPPPPAVPAPPYFFVPAFNPRLKLPRTYQWNGAIEQSLGSSQSITATYVGAAGRSLLRRERLFQPNPDFFIVSAVTNLATSDYHALQLRYRRRLSRGLQALASYTWSHSIDIGSTEALFNLPGSRVPPKVDRGSSDFDVRHSFSAGMTYDIARPPENSLARGLFHNWSIDALFRARTGTPVNIITGNRIFGVFSVSRPDLIDGVPLYLDDSSAAGRRRINSTAFSIPPPVRQGTLGRNALRGFPATQLDLALRRQFRLTEGLRLQLRAELFNVFNHPNFGNPESNLSEDALFGESISMLGRSLGGLNPLYQIGGPRSIQLVLRLQF